MLMFLLQSLNGSAGVFLHLQDHGTILWLCLCSYSSLSMAVLVSFSIFKTMVLYCGYAYVLTPVSQWQCWCLSPSSRPWYYTVAMLMFLPQSLNGSAGVFLHLQDHGTILWLCLCSYPSLSMAVLVSFSIFKTMALDFTVSCPKRNSIKAITV